ncbi:ribosomal protein [Musa troglodytarum]|uniref:Large ribosomal subunit protein uL4m n=1 Tax=Musa troglodytarum TaxID=320322 RepID=A0A9E7H7X4_9LILI|nr:ribosomal protein [Musa troglodytarum]
MCVESAAVSKAVLRDSFAHFRCSNRGFTTLESQESAGVIPPELLTTTKTVLRPDRDIGQYADLVTRVTNFHGEDNGFMVLAGDVFDVPIRKDIIHRVVRWQLAKRQQGKHSTKTISEVGQMENTKKVLSVDGGPMDDRLKLATRNLHYVNVLPSIQHRVLPFAGEEIILIVVGQIDLNDESNLLSLMMKVLLFMATSVSSAAAAAAALKPQKGH